MHRVVLLILLVLQTSLLTAQVPGYLGRKTLIGIGIQISPSLISRDLSVSPIHFQERIEVSRVLSRNFALGISLNSIHSALNYSWHGKQGVAGIAGMAAGLNVQVYHFARGGNIAPIGPFEKLEILYVGYRMRDRDGNFFSDGRENLGSYSDLAIGLTLGTRRILSGSIFYSGGLQFAYATGWFNQSGNPDELELKRLSSSLLKGYFAVNLSLGIGILLP
jgi:hypothetical protein